MAGLLEGMIICPSLLHEWALESWCCNSSKPPTDEIQSVNRSNNTETVQTIAGAQLAISDICMSVLGVAGEPCCSRGSVY